MSNVYCDDVGNTLASFSYMLSRPQYTEYFVKSMENNSASFFTRWAGHNSLIFFREIDQEHFASVRRHFWHVSWPQFPEFFREIDQEHFASAPFLTRWAGHNSLIFFVKSIKNTSLQFGAVFDMLSWPQFLEFFVKSCQMPTVTMGNTSENELSRSWSTFGAVFAVLNCQS